MQRKQEAIVDKKLKYRIEHIYIRSKLSEKGKTGLKNT